MQGGADHFATLGIERKFFLDNAALERRFYQLQRSAHPDNYAGAGSDVVAGATTRSGDINAAYRILRDPELRARHLLSLYGLTSDSSRTIPLDLADLVMNVQEVISLYEMGMANAGNIEIETQLDAKIADVEREIDTLKANWDAEPNDAILKKIAAETAALSYLRTLRSSLRAAKEGKSHILKH